MTEDDTGTLRSVAWSEILPWVNLFRTFRLAIGFRCLVLASVAMLVMFSGWWTLIWAFSPRPTDVIELRGPAAWLGTYRDSPWRMVTDAVPDRPFIFGGAPGLGAPYPPPTIGGATPGPSQPSLAASGARMPGAGENGLPIVGTWSLLTQPLLAALRPDTGLVGLACLALAGLWSLAVWAFFGAAITRIAAVQLACEERPSWATVMRHAVSKWLAYFAAPLFPLIGVLLSAIPIWLCGYLLRSNVGTLMVAVIWPLFLIDGLLIGLLLLGVIFGWPLMWATISAEGTDSFDALSRSYAYLFQRPLHFLFYVVVAVLFGWLGWILVAQFAAGVIAIAYWAASWGSGQPRMDAIVSGAQELGALGGAGATLIHVWAGCVKWVAVGYLYSYFWVASTAIYYLLRRNVDATEMDEVFLEDDEQSYELPPLKTEGPDAPEIASAAQTENGGGKTPDQE